MKFPGRRKIKHYFPVNADNRLYSFLQQSGAIDNQYAGGTIGNTLHNYSILADDRSVQFEVMSQNIRVGDYAYGYLCNTSSKVDMAFLQPVCLSVKTLWKILTGKGNCLLSFLRYSYRLYLNLYKYFVVRKRSLEG